MTLEEAYRIYLGREPDAGGLAANKQLYGNELDDKELERFLYGAAPEIRARDTTGGTFSVEDLYLGGLRRAGDPGGLTFYKEQFGPEISDQELVRFMLGGAGELPNAPMYKTSTDVDQGVKTISDVTDREKSTSAVASETPEQKAERARIDSLMARKGDLTKFITPLLENVPYGQKLGVGTEGASNVGLLNLYKNVLGRRPDEAGYKANLANVGPTLSPQDIANFRAGAVPELDRQRTAQLDLENKLRAGAASNLVAAPTRPTLTPNFQYVPGSLTSIPQNIVDLYQTQLGRAPDLAGGMDRAYRFGPSIEPAELAEFQRGTIASGEKKAYAGGPVMGSPQYFAEGGESKGMTKYSGKDLGSTFDVSDYVDESGRLVGGQLVPVVEEGVTVRYDYKPYERDVVFGRGLREAEAAARSTMTPEDIEEARRALNMRRGLTGIDPYTGYAPMAKRPYYMAKGGLADIAMRGYAEELRQQGRNGDTILAHINPTEAKMLEAMGGSGTINPRTGLPEYGFSWKKLLGVAGKVLPFVPIPGLFGMSSLLTKSVMSGLLAGSSAKGGFDLKRALGAGAMSYGLGSIGEKVMGATPSGEAITTNIPREGFGATPTNIAPVTAASANLGQPMSYSLADFTTQGGPPAPGMGLGSGISSDVPIRDVAGRFVPSDLGSTALSTPTTSPDMDLGGGFKIGSVSTSTPSGSPLTKPSLSTDLYTKGPGVRLTEKPLSIIEGAGVALTGYGLEKGAEADEKQQAIYDAAQREKEEREKMMRELAERLGRENPYGYAMGGEVDPVAFEGGGMTAPINQPRMLSGGGDGMSDSIPATIDGTQPARLADGEFVIPADVVADIGNGSSSAGAKRLYGMMDRVRTARHGTTKQPPEIKMNRLMPA